MEIIYKIQVRHYAERSWANFISTPLQLFRVEALRNKSDSAYLNKSSMLKIPKLFLRIGAEGTSSSELLTESLVREVDKSKSAGYEYSSNIAVHGKYDPDVCGFPNIDRLGSCMWTDSAYKRAAIRDLNVAVQNGMNE